MINPDKTVLNGLPHDCEPVCRTCYSLTLFGSLHHYSEVTYAFEMMCAAYLDRFCGVDGNYPFLEAISRKLPCNKKVDI